jgi:lysophospholipase L1-like esterase
VILHAVLLFMLVKSDFVINVYKTLGGTFARVERNPGVEIAWNRLRNIEKTAVGARVLFLGDSNLALVDVVGISPKALQLSMENNTARMMADQLHDYRSLHSALAVIKAIGQNDLLFRPASEVIQDIKKVIDMVPPRTPLVLSTLLPVDEALGPKEKRNTDIREINKALKAHCMARAPLCQFVDATPILADANGNLKDSAHVGDGVHVSIAGNILCANEIRRGLKQLL